MGKLQHVSCIFNVALMEGKPTDEPQLSATCVPLLLPNAIGKSGFAGAARRMLPTSMFPMHADFGRLGASWQPRWGPGSCSSSLLSAG